MITNSNDNLQLPTDVLRLIWEYARGDPDKQSLIHIYKPITHHGIMLARRLQNKMAFLLKNHEEGEPYRLIDMRELAKVIYDLIQNFGNTSGCPEDLKQDIQSYGPSSKKLNKLIYGIILRRSSDYSIRTETHYKFSAMPPQLCAEEKSIPNESGRIPYTTIANLIYTNYIKPTEKVFIKNKKYYFKKPIEERDTRPYIVGEDIRDRDYRLRSLIDEFRASDKCQENWRPFLGGYISKQFRVLKKVIEFESLKYTIVSEEHHIMTYSAGKARCSELDFPNNPVFFQTPNRYDKYLIN
tara:strand:+ start:3060 stop:3950 length:891 start_codon:yes stop_codon:yes gene_type:complete